MTNRQIQNTKKDSRSKTPDKESENKTNKNYTFGGNCWKCGEFGHSAKECQNNLTTAHQDQTHNSPTNIQPIEPIIYPTPVSPTRPPILTQQIIVHFQLA